MKKSLLLIPLLALLLQGCGVTMTRYEPSYDNVQRLKQQQPLQPIAGAQVTAAPGQGSLSVRANPIRSPSGSISQHIQEGLNEELRRAGLLDPKAPRQLQVLIVTNQLEAGVGSGSGQVAARFTLSKSDQVLYEATKQASSSWDSSFIGAIAIPNAAHAYNPLVRELLKNLYSDPLFIQALK
ncbi:MULTISPECIES: hypothetical protein [unclassified Pseudomonas]|uniref:hypothetical protein n=1 Tax=unclassified Pseudomonas TaxID=196821 RepID=UPI000839152F|nr:MULTISPECIES: hypothetical protein [unclassified Pseudomonas]QIH08812.1 hypothetical protein ATY02_19785 [Pseudomonas sp. BIOMIG1BAC]